MRNVYWLAIDKNDGNATYDELQDRKVVAQGWNSLGDLSSLIKLIPSNKAEFITKIQSLGDEVYKDKQWWNDKDRKENNAPEILWKLLNLKKGDLIVGVEGTIVKGICEIKEDAIDSYKYQNHAYNEKTHTEYSQTVGGPVIWVDWCKFRLGQPPTTSRRGIKGIKNLNSKREAVIKAWESINENDSWWSEEAINETLKMNVVPRDDKVYFKHISDTPRLRYALFSDYLSKDWKLRNHKKPSDIIEFESIESVIKAGWVID